MNSEKNIFKVETRLYQLQEQNMVISHEFPKNTLLYSKQNPKNNDEHQPRLSNFFKNFDSNGGDDLCYPGGLDQRYGYSSVGRFDVFFCNQLLVFQQHQDESIYDSWTHFKDIIRKVLNHGLSIWTLIEIFLKHLDSLSHHIINLTAEGDLRKFSDIGAWYMSWLDYDEHVDSLSMMNNEVGVTSPKSTIQTLPSFEKYTPSVTYPEEVEKTSGTPIEVEPLNETKLEEVDLSCNHNTPLSSREVPSFDGPEPQPLLNGIDDPKRHYGFKPGLLGKSVSLGVDISNWEMFNDDWRLESKEVSSLGEELSLFKRPNEVERGRILKAHRLEPILQQ
ncbi:hypothetical protein Tco_0452651 [Tanacetum coccineum]